jgi:hypothetical protein
MGKDQLTGSRGESVVSNRITNSIHHGPNIQFDSENRGQTDLPARQFRAAIHDFDIARVPNLISGQMRLQ